MPASPFGLIDRLAERGLVDRWGFMAFAFGGSAMILLAKSAAIPSVPVALGAVLAMVAYAAVVQRSGTGRLRADQAGDNCYYLGLIYTLASLAYAIFFFDPSDTATTIIQGFGIALSTTITGLVLRVFFHQSRVDLVQTEDTARIELADAAGRLKAELSSTVVAFNDFGRQTRQSLEEMREEVLRSLATAREATDAAVKEAAAAVSAGLAEQSSEALGRAKRFAQATDKVVAAVERQAEVLGSVGAATEGLSQDLIALHDAATATRSAMEVQAEQATNTHRVQSEVLATATELRAVTAQLLENVRAFDGTAGSFAELVERKLAEVRRLPEEMASDTKAAVEEVLAELRDSLAQLATATREISTELAARAGESLSLTQRHNEALEHELSRSRENASKVHAALVEMTGELADRLEGERV